MKEYKAVFDVKTDVTQTTERVFYSPSFKEAKRLTGMLAVAIGGECTVTNPDTGKVTVIYNLGENKRSSNNFRGRLDITPEQIGFIWAKFPVAGDIEDYIRKKNPDADIRRL